MTKFREYLVILKMAGTGLELSHETTGNSIGSSQSGAESGALDTQNGPIAPDLVAVVNVWPTLPADVRQRIVALARGAVNG
jgi:hypothetical protein